MTESVRLNKYLSDIGVCSRRAADRMTEEGRITVDGAPALVGMKVSGQANICIDGAPVKKEEQKVYLALHKPRGIVCTAQKKEKNNIIDYVNYPVRVYPVGRLDKDSEGLILLTNDGSIVNGMMRARNYHEKEYVVRTDREPDEAFLKKMQTGVAILDTVTRPCRVWKTGEKEFHIILTQGLNRQIRRMCEACGYQVRILKRLRIMNIKLGNLPKGKYRELTEQELTELRRRINSEE